MTNPNRTEPPLILHLFGLFEARVDGRPLPGLRTRKGQSLLAFLALRAGSEVERTWLAGLLWPESSERLAGQSLRTSLADLRRALGSQAGRLRSPRAPTPTLVREAGPRTLALDLDGAEVDVLAFDAAIARGDIPSLGQAVSLYRGPLLEGWVEEWVFQERQVREQAYLRALETLAADALARGNAAAAEQYLRRAVGVDPLRESAQRGLIHSLAAGGNYAAAMQVYRELRVRLHQDLNTTPDPETQALFAQIRAEARSKAALGSRLPALGGARGTTDGLGPAAVPAGHRIPPAGSGEPGAADGSEATFTFLFADIAGSTRLWEQHGDSMPEALARHDALLRQAIEARGGHVFKTVGDQCCAAFATAPTALHAALAAQQAASGVQAVGRSGVQESGPEHLNARPPERLEFRVRMALHTGTALEREGDYLGPALNRAARLLAAAHGGQILLSRATHELVREDLPEGVSLRDLGTHRLKDLQQPEHLFQLQHPGLPAEFAPVRSLEAFAHNLPIQVTSFVGREAATAEVKRLLTTTRLLTLTGAGGCGKTRLALQVAADLLDEESDGAWFVDLAPLTDPALVPQTVASVLGIREEAGRPLMLTLVDALLPKKLLLILDNCEHLLAGTREAGGCAALAEALLHRCPGVQILATSRERLNISGETTYRIPSLSSPDPATLHSPLSTLTQYEAVRLFIDRAIAVVPAFTVTNTNAPAVAEICHRLDGIPLAIELAAARVRVLSAEQIAARLDDRFRLLTGGSRASLPRQQTLRALIDWSYDLLAEPERTLLRRLSVFAGGWTLEAAEAVCGDCGLGIADWGLGTAVLDADSSSLPANPQSAIPNPQSDMLDLLTSLVDKSLVQYEERAGEGRYRLLETIRQYGRERLEEAGDAAAAQVRHCEWFLSLAERAEPELWGPRQVEWLDRLEREHDNLRAALGWCQKAGARGQGSGVSSGKDGLCSSPSLTPHPWPVTPAEMGLRLGGALWRFWELRGYFGEGREHLAGLLALPGADARTAVRARALRSAGAMAYCQGDCGAVRAYCEEGLAIFREIGDRSGIAWLLSYLRWTATFQGDDETARALAEESLAAFREAGDQPGIAWSLISMAFAVADQGDLGAARALAEESLGISRGIGHKEGMAWSLGALGDLAYYAGDYGTARALYEESLTMQRELGNKFAIAMWLFDLGEVCRAQGDYGEARALHREGLAMSRQQGSNGMIVRNLEGLAAVAIEQAQYERAARLHGAAEGLRAANGDAPFSLSPAAYERSITHLRAALGEGAFVAACAEGRAMPLAEVLALALEE